MGHFNPMNTLANRSGHYQQMPTGYQAFIPAPLPPNPPVRLTGELPQLLSKAAEELGRLDGSVRTLPNPDLFVLMYVRKESVLSSQIEGAQSSLHDLLGAEAKLTAPEHVPARDIREIQNHVRAMRQGLAKLHELPVSIRLIRAIHQILMQGVRGHMDTPGEVRRSQNWIGPAGCTLNEALFVPPPPAIVPEALGELEKFLHQNTKLPPLVKIGLAHAQFETIHPFLDGNGRMGRLLITFLLTEMRILHQPVLYLSHYFKRHRDAYYQHLQAVRDEGAWESWLAFFLHGIAEVSIEAAETARRILAMREQHRSDITTHLGRGAGNGLKALESLFERPIITINQIREATGTTYPAAHTLTSRLVDLGILQEISGYTRNRRFRYDAYVALFAD